MLQRDQPITLWGFASFAADLTEVTVRITRARDGSVAASGTGQFCKLSTGLRLTSATAAVD